MTRLFFSILVCCLFTFIALPQVGAAEPDDWEELLPTTGADKIWRKVDPRWILSSDVTLDPERANRLKARGGSGSAWVNGDTGRLPDLYTLKSYQDCEVHVEFMMARNSNSGIKFHGVYEIQLRDSANNKGKLTGDDCGGIYPMGSDLMGYRQLDIGTPPRVNSTKQPGEWQTLDVIFRAPRFDASGKKIERAMIVKAVLNGQIIHENVSMKYPTGTNWEVKEVPRGPFMLQADHGPVAFRNVKIRELK